MATESEHERVQADLRDLDAQIAEQRASADDLRAQVGGHDAGPQDAEDVAAALTSVEEIEGILDALTRRRETLLAELDGS